MMELYVALATDVSLNVPMIKMKEVKRFLMSYHSVLGYPRLKPVFDKLHAVKKAFLDSGAFSAFTMGSEINLDNYCKFIIDNDIDLYANLDVIGDPEGTFRNQRYMEKEFGLKPLPTFHTGENKKYLIEIVENYDQMALGGMVGCTNLDSWLPMAWRTILEIKPEMMVHGFGLTSVDHLLNYPWHSCDSSSYSACVRYARIPIFLNGRFESITIEEYCREHNYMFFEDDMALASKTALRREILKDSVREYLKMEKWVNKEKKKIDYSYLLKQKKLFDL